MEAEVRSTGFARIAGLLALSLAAWPQQAGATHDSVTIAESVARFSNKHIASVRRSIDRAVRAGRIRSLARPQRLDKDDRVRRRGQFRRPRFDTRFGHGPDRLRRGTSRDRSGRPPHGRRAFDPYAPRFGARDRFRDRRRPRSRGDRRRSVYRYRVITPRQRTLRSR